MRLIGSPPGRCTIARPLHEANPCTRSTCSSSSPSGMQSWRRSRGSTRGLRVVDARGWFDDEIRQTWPQWSVERYLGSAPVRRAHARSATASWLRPRWSWAAGRFPSICGRGRRGCGGFINARRGPAICGAGICGAATSCVTTSRGHGNTRAMAEYVLACFLHFARGLHRAYRDRQRQQFEHRTYQPILIEGKTVCVIGAGGIGQAVGSLCAGAGMRVVGTRRHVSPGDALPSGFSRLESPEHVYTLLGESDFVAVCCQWTPETTGLIGRAAFAAMRPGTVLVNVARGEIIDEEALIAALAAGKAAWRRSGRLPRGVRACPRSAASGRTNASDHAACLRRYGCRAASGRRGVLRQSARLSGRATARQRDRLGAGLLISGRYLPLINWCKCWPKSVPSW